LQSHPGPRTAWDVSAGASCEISSTKRFLKRLHADGKVKRQMPTRENAFYLYEVA
jgi:hypothetical protein